MSSTGFETQQVDLAKSEQSSTPADMGSEAKSSLPDPNVASPGSQKLVDSSGAITWNESRASFWQPATTPETMPTTPISQLLEHVACGEQAEAELMLVDNPALSLQSGSVIDLSKRRFADITALQYALWAMDWRMWQMLLRYMPQEVAWQQYEDLETKGTLYGTHFNLISLINALEAYLNNYDAWYAAGAWRQINTCWCKEVGGAQFLLPAHVAQEYCHPRRSFKPLPNFSEKEFKRSLQMDEGSWYADTASGERLGETFGIIRGEHSEAFIPRHRMQYFNLLQSTRPTVESDLQAMRALLAIGQLQLQAFKAALQPKVTLRV